MKKIMINGLLAVAMFFSMNISLNGMAIHALNDHLDDLENLVDLRRPLTADEAGRLNFLRDSVSEEAEHLERFFAEDRVRYPALGNMREGEVRRLARNMIARVDARYPHAATELRDVPGDGPEEKNFLDKISDQWVEHPVRFGIIVVGGVAVVGLTIDAITRGKNSVLGKFFFPRIADAAVVDDKQDEAVAQN